MATIDLNGTRYTLLGMGTHPPIEEKGYPLNNYGGNLSASEQGRIINDCLSYFSWLRVNISGLAHYNENSAGTKNYPAGLQAKLLRDINAAMGGAKTIASVISAPSSTMAEGFQTTRRIANGTAAGTVNTKQAFVANDANWTIWLEAIAHGINILKANGCDVRMLELPNEAGGGSVPNDFQVYLTSSQYPTFIRKIWLGEGLSVPGIKTRFPGLKLIYSDPTGGSRNLYLDALRSDATAMAEVSYTGLNIYGNGIDDVAYEWQLGITTYKENFGRCITTEFGHTVNVATAGLAASDIAPNVKLVNELIHLGRSPLLVQWTCLRDVTYKKDNATSNGVTYTAKPLCDLTTASNSFAFTPYWWALKPYLLAVGKGAAEAYVLSGTDAQPTSGVYVNHFKRCSDGKHVSVYANFSGGNRTTDTLAFSNYGSKQLIGKLRTFDVMASSGQESAQSVVATTNGSYSLGTVGNGKIVIVEWQ